MSEEAIVDLSGLELVSSKKVPVCICLDTSKDMRKIWDEEIIRLTHDLVNKHQNNPEVKQALEKNNQSISFDLMIRLFYDEFPESLKSRYGRTREDMLKRKMGSVETGAAQSKKVLKIFFETLRKEHQKAIDVEVCVITFSDGKADVVIPFTGSTGWDNDNWVKDLEKRDFGYESEKKSMLVGLYKATEELEKQLKKYQAEKQQNLRGRIVLLTKPTLTQESKIEKLKLENKVRSRLKEYKVIPVVLGKGKGQQESRLAGLAFPSGQTQFINASVSATSLEEIFKAISVSVSSGSSNLVPVASEDSGDMVPLYDDDLPQEY